MIVHVINKKGKTMLTINNDGQLCYPDGKPVRKVTTGLGLFEGGTRTALDGSRVTTFSTRWEVELRRFSLKGRTWWDAKGNLCDLKDIDDVRGVVQ